MIYVKSLKLNNFRCFKSISLEFKPNINILIGNNGCGKTSIVEAISYLCLGKSFKSIKDKDVLKINEDFFNIISVIVGKEENRIVVGYDGKQKRIRNGEIIYKSLSEHIGKYKLLSFCPDDLDIIKGNPNNRRRFIDVFISQCDSLYLKSLAEYKKILKMRNEFLKSIINNQYDKVYFDVLNEKLVKNAEIVINIRKKYFDLLNKYINIVCSSLTNPNTSIKLVYEPDVIDVNDIKKAYNIDLCSGISTRGPQKDDFVVLFNDKNASIYASQGQIRLCILAMKLAIYEMFRKKDENIFIILDDVFSELDKEKQIYLMNYIKNVGQVFITTTEIDKIPKQLIDSSNIIEMKDGERND